MPNADGTLTKAEREARDKKRAETRRKQQEKLAAHRAKGNAPEHVRKVQQGAKRTHDEQKAAQTRKETADRIAQKRESKGPGVSAADVPQKQRSAEQRRKDDRKAQSEGFKDHADKLAKQKKKSR